MIHLVGEKQQRLFFREKYIQRGTMRNSHIIRVLFPFFLEAFCIQMYLFPLVQSCCCLVAKSYLTVCGPVDGSPSGSSVHGISQARILKWVAILYCRGSPRSRDQTCVSCIGKWILYPCATWKALFFQFSLVAQSCPTL